MAVYAAIVATGILIWDVVKWIRSGPVLKLECWPGNKIFVVGGKSSTFYEKPMIYIKVSNRGSKTTTLNNIFLIWYKNVGCRLLNKSAMRVNIPNPKLTQDFPYKLAPGSEWSGALNEGDLDIKTKESGIMICQLFHSFSDKPIQSRIFFRIKNDNKTG